VNHSHTLRIQSAFRDFAKIDHWVAPHAVTLTMKQGVPVANGYRSTMAFLDADKASQNMSHFHSILSRRVLGKPASRFGMRVRMIPVQERSKEGRLHYHVLIDCPRAELQDAFPALIQDIWVRTQWGHRQNDIQADADDGFKFYISKLRDKPDYADAVDWANYHNPD